MKDDLFARDVGKDRVLVFRPDRHSATGTRGRPKSGRAVFNFYEFFAGGGMARAGLGARWHCSFANDIDSMKGATYCANWGPEDMVVADVNLITTSNLPGQADLAWASFPCQDLSLAGKYAGIGLPSADEQTRSGSFWPFWRLMSRLTKERRAPRFIVLENVYGALTSNGGRDFKSISDSLTKAGYRFGVVVIDAKLFLPQSRPRVFFVCVKGNVVIPARFRSDAPKETWHPSALRCAYEKLSNECKTQWVWWNLPVPTKRFVRFADLIDETPIGVEWHTSSETAKLIRMMSPVNRTKLDAAKRTGQREVGGVYKRTRIENGVKMQRAEVRFDGLAGCLRTPSGGSSRQSIVVVEGARVRSRLLSPREAARLMGLPDSYRLPLRYNDGYHVAGDGVAVPVVRHLARNLIEPILKSQQTLPRQSLLQAA